MAEMKTLNGFEVVDSKAREDILDLADEVLALPIPTHVSELINDKGYLTEHQDLSHKADKIHTHKLSDITDYKEPDLTPYAKKTDIPTDYLTSIPAEYVTDSELTAKGYLTEHQSLDNYYTKAQTDNAIETAIDGIKIPEVDLKGYATEQYVNDAIADIDIPNPDLSNYYTKSEVDTAIENAATGDVDLSNYYTKAQVDTEIGNKAAVVLAEAQKGINAVDTKLVSTDATVAQLRDDLDNDYYPKSYIDTLFSGIATAEGGSY